MLPLWSAAARAPFYSSNSVRQKKIGFMYFNFNKYILLFRQIHIYAMQHTITQGLSGAKSCDALDQSRAPREKWCTVFITSHLVCANQSASKQVLISVVIMCICLQPRICWCPRKFAAQRLRAHLIKECMITKCVKIKVQIKKKKN